MVDESSGRPSHDTSPSVPAEANPSAEDQEEAIGVPRGWNGTVHPVGTRNSGERASMCLPAPKDVWVAFSRHSCGFPTATQSRSWPTRTTPTSRREGSVQNWCGMGVNSPQPAIVARTAQHHPTTGANLDPGAGFLVCFSRRLGPSGEAKDVSSGISRNQFPVSRGAKGGK